MTYIDNDYVAQVRRNRELLLLKHEGIGVLYEQMEKERAELEEQNWKFISLEEVLAKKH